MVKLNSIMGTRIRAPVNGSVPSEINMPNAERAILAEIPEILLCFYYKENYSINEIKFLQEQFTLSIHYLPVLYDLSLEN